MRTMVAGALSILFAAGAQQELVLRVSPRTGNDRTGDGSLDKPFATLKRALELHAKVASRRAEIHLDLGHYGADRGETFPIRLPANARIVGFGSRTCEIVGDGSQPLFELPASGAVALENVALRGGSNGIVAAAGDAESRLDLALVDVAIETAGIAIDLAPARGGVVLRADGLRVTKAATGLAAGAAAALTLTLDRCEFSECSEGVAIGCDDAPDDGPWQALTVRGCRFEGNQVSGLARHGKDGRNRAPDPWRIESSRFRGSAIGLSFEIPGGDVPFVLRDCDFTANDNFGLAIVGSGAALPGASRIEGCRFRWNGVGAQVLTMGRALELSECRFEDSIGIGFHFGNFAGARSLLRAERCLFVCNGAAGFFGLCEQENGVDVTLDRCSIVDNRGSGLEKKNRKRGSGSWLLTRCIVTGNAPDLQKIEPAETRECLLGADPRFVDRAGRDFRPAADSPARTAAGVVGALE